MAGLVDWTAVDTTQGKQGGNDKSIWLRLEAGKKYRIRPIGRAMEVHRYYIPDGNKTRSAITGDPENCIIRRKYPNHQPKLRYAFNIIDREDGKVKVLEAPLSVCRAISAWAEATKKDPGSIKDGVDFSISVELPANGDKRRTTYPTTPLLQTPLTDDELTYVKQNGQKLEKLLAPTPQSEIEGILFPQNSSTNSAPRTASSNQASQATSSQRPTAAADEDEFSF